MTMQFLASVRRNQRQWMVVLTILSIFAFLFDDVARGANNLSANSTALFIGVLCAGAMSILGYPRGHTVMYGLIGFIAGGGAALVGSAFAGNKPLVRTNLGNFSVQDLRELQTRRIKAERFVNSVAKKVNVQPPSFGQLSEREMVALALMQREARRLGVTISDEAVNEYIKEFTRDKLSKSDFSAALRDTGVGETEIFDLIRGELAARLVYKLMFPPALMQQALPYLSQGQMTGRITQFTPEQLWDNFKKLNLTEQLSAVAVPISEFVKVVPEPSESEVTEYFDKHKSRMGDEFGNPGFLELPKVRLGYLVAANLEEYEKGLPKPTDQEVVDYYTAHLKDYRAGFEMPDSITPNLKSEIESLDKHDPADATTPTNTLPETPAPDKSTDAPATDKKVSDKPESNANQPAEPAPEKEEAKKSGGSCGEDAEPAPAQADEAKPQATEASAQPADQPAEKQADKPSAPDLPSPGDAPPTGPGIQIPGVPEFSNARPGLPDHVKFPAPRYRELNDDLKLEIHEKILAEKAFQKMVEAADQAKEFMEHFDLEYAAAEQAKRAEVAKGFIEKLKDYGARHGMEYHETKEMTFRELSMSSHELIGAATSGNSGQRSRTVAEEVFASDASGRGYFLPVYTTRRADTPRASYAYWKIEEIPAKVADLKNEATHQLVVDAWKFEKARELADKRTRELVELMKKSPADIPGALSGQTINGTPESPAVTVHETPKFTWLRSQQSFPSMGQASPVLSTIDGIDSPGADFMKTVFEDLGNGDVGAALNRSRTVFYAMRVHDRVDLAADGGVSLQTLQLQFMNEKFTNIWPTPYDYMSAQAQMVVDNLWYQNFNTRYGIKFERPELPDMDE